MSIRRVISSVVLGVCAALLMSCADSKSRVSTDSPTTIDRATVCVAEPGLWLTQLERIGGRCESNTELPVGSNPTATVAPLRDGRKSSEWARQARDRSVWDVAVWKNAVAAVQRSEWVSPFPATIETPAARAVTAPSIPATSHTMPCGGADYPPCYVAQRESGNTYTAYNPTGCGGSGCYGRWQASGAWAGHFGLPMDIAHWTPAQQDYFAKMLWDGGRGCSNWDAC